MRVRLLLLAILAGAAAALTVFGGQIPNLGPDKAKAFALIATILAGLLLLNIVLHLVPRRFARGFELLITVAILAVLIGGISYVQFVFKPKMIKDLISKMPPPVATVMAKPAKAETWVPKVTAIGTFRASEGIDIAPQLGGWVTARRFDSGNEVKAGTLLIEIDTTTEVADLKNGNAQLKNTEVALDRQRQLLSSSNTSRSAYDSALAARDSAAATVERYKAIIAQKMIRAPFSGRLGIRKVDVGQWVSPGTALVTLQKITPLYLDFTLPEQNVAILRADQPVEITVDPYPGRIFTGKIQSIDARVNQDTRNILVRAQVDNEDKALLPGMFATINVIAGAPREVVTVPRTAITYSLYGDSIFVVKPEPPKPAAESTTTGVSAGRPEAAGKPPTPPKPPTMIVERRFVRVGDTQADRVSIKEGIKPGDVVVVGGQIKLQPNSHVRVNEDAILEPPAVRPRA